MFVLLALIAALVQCVPHLICELLVKYSQFALGNLILTAHIKVVQSLGRGGPLLPLVVLDSGVYKYLTDISWDLLMWGLLLYCLLFAH